MIGRRASRPFYSQLLFLIPLLGINLFAQAGAPLREQSEATWSSDRVTVAMLPLENATGDPALDHWRFAASSVIGPHLQEAQGLRLLPLASVKYGLNQLNKKPGDHLEATEARRLGEIIEARRVLWGSFGRERNKWRVTLYLMNVAEGIPSKALTVSSTDWFQMRDKVTPKILKELQVIPTNSERQNMKGRWTKSADCLEWLARAKAGLEAKRPAVEWEDDARRAVAADPRCAEALVALASCAGTQGKWNAAIAAAKQAIELNPRLAMAHSVLGSLQILSGNPDQAEDSLAMATLLDPDNPTLLGRLAEFSMIKKELPDAIEDFEDALRLSPFQASLNANLGRAYLFQGKREAGLKELKEAERLTFEPDLNTEEFLAWGYEQLNNAPAAIEHYEKVLTIGRKVGLNPERMKELEQEMNKLNASLAPVYVTAHPPIEYSDQSLTKALAENLAPDELELVIRPLEATPEMNLWAKGLAGGASNTVQKANMLYEALAGHLDVGQHRMRTAAEVYSAWQSPAAAFSCQEYSFLFVAMARASGLRAFIVSVEEAWNGDKVSHACAAVFDVDKVLLVDPSYRWFGVPHKKFTVMNDLESITDYLSQCGDIQLRRIAVKLAPDSAYARFKLATKYVSQKQWEAAQAELPILERLDSNGAQTYYLKAALALHEKKLEETVDFSQHALEHGWPVHDSGVHMILGNALAQQGLMKESREAFRTALRRSPDEDSAQAAWRAIARINEKIGNE